MVIPVRTRLVLLLLTAVFVFNFNVIYDNFSGLSEWFKLALSQWQPIEKVQIKERNKAPEFFIDVWKLRHDVAELEILQASDNTDHCYQEGGGGEEEDAVVSPQSQKELELQKQLAEKQAEDSRICVKEIRKTYQKYMLAYDVFNNTWLPLINHAIESGDPVAEVIMRQCSTTPVLDRSHIESTCDSNPQRRAIAAKSLREIGFAPAFDWEYEIRESNSNFKKELSLPKNIQNIRAVIDQIRRHLLSLPQNKGAFLDQIRLRHIRYDQNLMLEQFGNGIYGFYGKGLLDVSVTNAYDETDQARYRLIVEANLITPRAFTFSPAQPDRWATGAFGTLKLNRPQSLTPGVLTWGSALFSSYDDKPAITGDGFTTKWRYGNLSEVPRETRPYLYQPIDAVRDLIAKSEANINIYLKQDPRWGVFLLHRMGDHEWVPEGIKSDSHKLTEDLAGKWQLVKSFHDWSGGLTFRDWGGGLISEQEPTHTAIISNEGELSKITFQTKATFPEDAVGCVLRYSGGTTYLPKYYESTIEGDPTLKTVTNQEWSNTMFGDLEKDCFGKIYVTGAGSKNLGNQCTSSADNGYALAPLDPQKQYQQVLVQCPEGESTDSDQMRFLLLNGDTMVEFSARGPYNEDLYIRHFHRVAANVTSH